MHFLVPHFILEKFAAGEIRGEFRAVGLFCDISGFSSMTEKLMQYGQHGTEVLATIMRDALSPLIQAVYEQGGFVATQAGDAFTALFPLKDGEMDFQHALAAAWFIQQRSMAQPVHKTDYGDFSVSVKVGLAEGDVSWGIVKAENVDRAAYYFQGSAVDACAQAEHYAQANEIVLDQVFYGSVEGIVQADPLDGYYLVRQVKIDLPEAEMVHIPAPDLEVMAHFFPRELITQSQRGEFRQTTTLFVHLPTIRTETQLRIFTQTLFELQDHFGGLLNRLDFGDKGAHLLLFWGAPVAYENDIERVLNFILRLQIQTSIPISAGITHRISNAGFIGSELREEYTCYGPGINLAARMMSAAPRGEIWVDEVVAKRARNNFEIDEVGDMTFKGFANKQKVFVLFERRGHHALMAQSQIVGRKHELEALASFVQPVFSGQFPGVMVVWGEAGIGKSRLVYEFQNAPIFKEQDALWIVCKSDEVLKDSLNPFRYWLQSYFDVSDAQVESRNKRNFNRKLDSLILSLEEDDLRLELDRTRSFLGAILNLYWPDSLYAQLDAKGRYENIFIGLDSLLKAESQRQPVILLLEDGQWLDEDSKEFLKRFVRSLTCDGCQVFPIALLATSRYSAEPFPLEGKELHLEGLSWIELAEYAETILGEKVSPVLLDLLEQKGEGNPFFVEQILRYLQEKNALVLDETGSYVPQAIGDSPLPDDIRLVLVSRLDRLILDVRQTVQAASVLGQEFETRLLRKMIAENDAFPSWVQQAERSGIWSSLSEIRYMFSHALLRETAYKMQLRSRREMLHGLVVEIIENTYPNELSLHYSELAYHSEIARLVDKSRLYLKLAGDQAAENFQNSQGVNYYSRALELTPQADLDDLYQLYLAREALYNLQGRRKEQVEDLQALERIAKASGDPQKQAWFAVRQGEYWLTIGDYPEAAEAARQGIDLAERNALWEVSAKAQFLYSNALYYQGSYALASQSAQECLVFARKNGYRTVEGRLLNLQGMICWAQGKVNQARDYFERSLEIFKPQADLQNQALPLNNLGMVFSFLGNFLQAQKYYEQALGIAHQSGDRFGEGIILTNLGYTAGNQGDYGSARSLVELSIRIAREIGNPLNELYGLLNLSSYAGLLGDHTAALENADRALRLASETEDRSSEAWAQTYRGHALDQLGQYDQAHHAYTAALEIRNQLSQDVLAVEPSAGLARLALQNGEPQAALHVIQNFLPLLEAGSSLEGTDEPVRIYLTGYQVLSANGDPRAGTLLDAGHQLLTKRLQNIEDFALRQSYVDAVSYNRDLIAAWDKMKD